MFANDQNEQSAGGSEMPQIRGAITSVIEQTNTESPPEQAPERKYPPGTTALAWWDDMKYYWRRNSNGNGFHLAPQDNYVDDVIVEGDVEISRAAKDFLDEKSNDLDLAKAELASVLEIIETRDAFDTSGIESAAVIRSLYRDRIILARKICGATAVSANHRLQNAAATNGDIQAVQDSDMYKNDLENCHRWAFKACYYEWIASQLPKNDVITDLPKMIAAGVKNALYDDAVDRGNRLKRPAPASQPNANKLSPEELRQLRA